MVKATILIVEDETIVAEDLSRKLSRIGYEIAGVSGRGEEAISLAREQRPDLVLMDIHLKGKMDGVEAAQIIRQECDIPVIYLTAHSDSATLQRAKLTEPFGYILKPFQELELEVHIQVALHKHKAEREVRQQREWLRVTLSSIGDAVITTDPVGRITSLNPVAEELTGWPMAEALGRPFDEVLKLIHEETREPAPSPIEKVLKEGKVILLANHTALVSRSGQERSIEDSAAPIKDAHGQILGVVMVFHDSTEKRRAEVRLLQINRTLTAHNESSQALLTTEDEAAYLRQVCRIITDHCRHAMVWIGFAEHDEAKSVRPVASSGFEEGYLQKLQVTWADTERGRGPTGTAIRTGQPSMCRDMRTDPRIAPWREEALRRGYGSSLVVPLLADSKALGAISIYSKVPDAFSEDEVELLGKLAADVARGLVTLRSRVAQRQAEQALRQSEERLKLALGAALAGAWDWDVRTGAMVWSQENYDLYGLDASKGPPSYADWQRNVHPDDLPGTRQAIRDALDHRSASYQAEFRVRHPSRGERWILGLGRVEHAADGTPQRMSGINIDITARKTFEAELERLVAERTAKSQEMIDELQHVSYSIVHDMRAPLRAMQGITDLLEEECDGCSKTLNQDYFRRIKTASGRMDRLITDALHYTKTVLQEVSVRPVNLSALLRGLLETYPNFHPDGAEIRFEGDLPEVMGNEALLTQCFANLLGNAVKFVAKDQKPRVRVWAETRGNGEAGMVRVWVEDNGIGIPKHAQARLFGMFQRLAPGYEGTGIGLAIVRKVVERMGGRVGVESEEGQGSRFWVNLRTPK